MYNIQICSTCIDHIYVHIFLFRFFSKFKAYYFYFKSMITRAKSLVLTLSPGEVLMGTRAGTYAELIDFWKGIIWLIYVGFFLCNVSSNTIFFCEWGASQIFRYTWKAIVDDKLLRAKLKLQLACSPHGPYMDHTHIYLFRYIYYCLIHHSWA